MLKILNKYLVLFSCGGFLYYIIEILWRGYSHISMIMVGGLCFVLIGLINDIFSWDIKLWKQMFVASCIVTLVEFLAGLVLNIWMKLGIWDYSQIPFNIMGQICLLYFVLWFFLSAVGIVLDDYLRYWLFKEEKPRYKIW